MHSSISTLAYDDYNTFFNQILSQPLENRMFALRSSFWYLYGHYSATLQVPIESWSRKGSVQSNEIL